MIIQSLVEQYHRLAQQQKVPLSGWSVCKVSYVLELDEAGNLISVADIREEKNKKKIPQDMVVPEQQKRTSKISPSFLADNATYLLGLDTKDKPEKAKAAFLAAKELHEKILGEVDEPAAQAVIRFFEHWNPEKVSEHSATKHWMTEFKKGVNLVFSFQYDYVHESPSIRKKWEKYLEKSEEELAVCSITGEKAKIARLHPLLKGVYGAQTAGASLVSFNAEAYNSYGKEQGMNAPISEKVAFEYGAALNYMLSNQNSYRRINDTTYVFWSSEQMEDNSNHLAQLFTGFSGSSETQVNQQQLVAAFNRIASGEPVKLADETISPDTDFYILGLAPNAARLSVRLFAHNKFSFFAKNILAHQERLKLALSAYNQQEHLDVKTLLKAITNEKSRDKKTYDILSGELLRAILLDTYYPHSLITTLSIRIRADEGRKITRERAAIIKAYYLKNRNQKCPEEVLTVSLNEQTTNIPYLLGRAFAILETIQRIATSSAESKGKSELNKTIHDKYFNSATATPSYVFPILINLSRSHLRKLKASKEKIGAGIALENQLSEILGKVGEIGFPKHLTLPEQGSFQLGYFQQREEGFQKALLKKAEKSNKGDQVDE